MSWRARNAIRLVLATALITMSVLDRNQLLVYWPSGRGMTAFEILFHGFAVIGAPILAITLLTVAGWEAYRYRKAIKRPAGLCPHCGYDLRATPERCPECGKTPEDA